MKQRHYYVIQFYQRIKYLILLFRGYIGLGKSIVSSGSDRLLYCPVPKAGWSTWKRLLYREAGVENLVDNLRQ